MIALIITIIVLLILAGVTINTIIGDEGVLNKASESRFKKELGDYKDELSLYKIEEKTNLEYSNGEVGKSPSYADANYLVDEEEGIKDGNITNIIKNIKDEYKDKFIIFYGTLYTTDKTTESEREWAKSMGIEYYPLDVAIKDGNVVLECTQKNLEELVKDDTLIIPEIITEIEEGTFNGINVKKIVIPSSVKTIGKNAFSNNTVLEEIEIQDGVKTIGASAFYGCSNLKKVTMTNSVTTLRFVCILWMQ